MKPRNWGALETRRVWIDGIGFVRQWLLLDPPYYDNSVANHVCRMPSYMGSCFTDKVMDVAELTTSKVGYRLIAGFNLLRD